MSRLASLRELLSLSLRQPRTARRSLNALFIAVRLRRQGLRPILGAFTPSNPSATADEARRLAADIDHAMSILPLEPTCLRRSAALLQALDKQGLSGELIVGVRTDDEPTGFGAHAWVEVDGEVVNDDADIRDRYVVITTGTDMQDLPKGLR